MNQYRIEWSVCGTIYIDSETRIGALDTIRDMTIGELIDRSGTLLDGPEYSIEKVVEKE